MSTPESKKITLEIQGESLLLIDEINQIKAEERINKLDIDYGVIKGKSKREEFLKALITKGKYLITKNQTYDSYEVKIPYEIGNLIEDTIQFQIQEECCKKVINIEKLSKIELSQMIENLYAEIKRIKLLTRFDENFISKKIVISELKNDGDLFLFNKDRYIEAYEKKENKDFMIDSIAYVDFGFEFFQDKNKFEYSGGHKIKIVQMINGLEGTNCGFVRKLKGRKLFIFNDKQSEVTLHISKQKVKMSGYIYMFIFDKCSSLYNYKVNNYKVNASTTYSYFQCNYQFGDFMMDLCRDIIIHKFGRSFPRYESDLQNIIVISYDKSGKYKNAIIYYKLVLEKNALILEYQFVYFVKRVCNNKVEIVKTTKYKNSVNCEGSTYPLYGNASLAKINITNHRHMIDHTKGNAKNNYAYVRVIIGPTGGPLNYYNNSPPSTLFAYRLGLGKFELTRKRLNNISAELKTN